MKIVIGSDHGGFAAKEFVKKAIQKLGHEVSDFGCHSPESVDYPDVAQLVAEAVSRGDFERGVLVDGFGGAVCLAANKVPGAYAALCCNVEMARLSREHNDANILVLGARFVPEREMLKMIRVWLSTEFEGGRHARRTRQIKAIEKKLNDLKKALVESVRNKNRSRKSG